ncbi:MAG: glycosyltransferase family 4 protein [Candidatus Omnitrophica bacterium]|nr:glycosyltransferase family 4 protein [Candidatus Omnitrophota bacterium]
MIANTEYGGGQRTFEVLAEHLPRAEFSLHVACDAADPFWKRMGALGVCRHAVSFRRTWSPQRAGQLARIIRQERIRLVHSQSRRADFDALPAARRCHVPIVSSVAVRTSSFDVSWLRKALYRVVEGWIERHLDLQITMSHTVEQAFLQAGLPRERVVWIPEAVDTSRHSRPVPSKEEACQRLGLDPQTFWVGSLGRLIALKGHRTLIEAAATLRDLPQVGFLLAGAGPLERELKGLIKELQVETRVRLLSFQDDPTAFYRALDLVVFPSLWGEAFPRVLLEAMMFGKPIVASDLPACREVLDNGSCAVLFPPGDVQALATALRELCQQPDRLARLGALARERVVAHYDVTRLIPRVVEAYRTALRSRAIGHR